MKKKTGFQFLSAFRQLLLIMVFAVVSLLLPMQAEAQSSPASFNHDTTMFALRGAHETVRCETCHINGVFKGTPRQCNLCHVQGSRTGAVPMTNNHIPVSDQCDVCHNTSSFAGTQFTHAMVMPGSCNTCHNGFYAKGKSPSPPHPITSASCDLCHSIGSFTNAIRFDHAASGIFAAPAHSGPACASCHNGVRAEGKSPNHVPVPAASACDDCHRQTSAWKPAIFVHEAAGISTTPKAGAACSSCHNGTRYMGKPAGNAHIPTTQDCSLCHSASPIVNPGGFALGQMDHTGITTGCATCHGYNSPYPPLAGKPLVTPNAISNHIPVQGVACEACHTPGSFTSFAGGVMNHSVVTSTSCATCHEDGANYAGLTATQPLVMRSSLGLHYPMPTSIPCSACHTSVVDFSQGIVYSPSGVHQAAVVSAGCATCHSDGAGPFAAKQTLVNLSSTASLSAGGLPHIDLNANVDCQSCHVAGKIASFNPGNNGFRLPGTPASPSLTAAQHSLVSTACSTCHGSNGNSVARYAGIVASTNATIGDTWPPVGLDASHQTYGNDCAGCHSTTPTFLSNAAGTVKPAGHIPTGNLSCATCHGAPASYSAPNLVATHTTGLACAACHNSAQSSAAAGLGTPVLRYNSDNGNHIPIGSLGNTGAAAGATTCDSAGCHANYNASGQSFVIGAGANPSSAQISTPTLNVAGHNSIYLAGVTSCSTCHENGATRYQGMVATVNTNANTGVAGDTRPTYNNHPAAGDCGACHSTTPTFAKNPSSSAQPAGHIPSGSAACSACHVGSTGNNFPAPDIGLTHSSQSQACSVCHNATVSAGITSNAIALGFGGKPAVPTVYNDASHFPVPGLDCAASGCHASSYAASSTFVLARGAAGSPSVAFAGHASVTSQTCVSCHDASKTYKGMVNNASALPTDVFPSSANAPFHQTAAYNQDCGVCHTVAPLFKTNAFALPPQHIPVGSVGVTCTNCHAAGNYGTAAVNLVTTHATGLKCSQCHDSSVAGTFITDKTIVSQASITNHIPFGSMDCGTVCHQNYSASVLNFKIGTGVPSITVPTLNVAQHTAVAAAGMKTCGTCHTQPGGTVYAGMLASRVGGGDQFPSATEDPNHANYTGDCGACHTTTPTFLNNANGTVKPAGHIPVGNLTCAACHGAPASYSAPNMVATHTTGLACAACHNSAQSSAAASLGTPIIRYNSDTGGTHFPIGTLGNSAATAGALTCNASGCHANYTASGQSFVVGSGATPTNAQITTPTLNVAGHNAIYTAGVTSCSTCHENGVTRFQGMVATINTSATSGTAGDTRPTYNNHPASGDCGQCHSTTPTFSLSPSSAAVPTGHIPIGSAACSACHKAASGNNFGAPDLALTHSTQSQACSACHNATVRTGIANNAAALGYGGVNAVPTVIADNTHFPIGSTDCAASGCHASYATSTVFLLARGSAGTPNVAFDGHASVTSQTCLSCHDATKTYKGMVNNANANPTDVFPSATQDPVHQAYTGDCGTCHTVAPLFNTNPNVLPPKHLPIGKVGITCTNCHASGNWGASGVNLVTTHATGLTCLTCHASAVASSFLVDAAMPIKSETSVANHIPFGSMDCGTACHGNYSSSVLNFKMNGTGVASITVPTLNVAQHAAVSAAGVAVCGTCHTKPGGTVYLGMLASAIGGGDQFPSITEDAAHQTYTGDCVSCHTTAPTFKTNAIGGGLPSNHIPLTPFGVTPACSACHINPNTYVTARMNHSPATGGIKGSCLTCHGAAGVALSFANVRPTPAPSNHIPTSVSGLANACEKCHNNAVTNNFNSFAGTVMDHSGVASSCITCHGVGKAAAFYGVTMVVAPNVAPDGHQFVATKNCETCHTNTMIPNGFANGKMIHAQVSTITCMSCHETGSKFTGVTGLWVRPSGHHTGQDCSGSGCHNTSDKALGTGTTAAAGRVLSATSLSLSSPAIGTAVTKTIALSNSGTAALTINATTGLVFSGTNAADFTQTNTCAPSVPAAGSCVITVSFKPSAAGNRTATLTLTDNSPSKTQAITLTGAVSTTSLSAASVVALSSTGIGTASPTQALTFTNTGTTTVTVSSVAITGTNAVDFKVASNTCTTALAAGASCTINIGFTPTINTAQESALLTIANNGFPSAYVLQLVGSTGTQSAAAQQRRVASGSQVVKAGGGLPSSVAALLGTATASNGNSMIVARGAGTPAAPGLTGAVRPGSGTPVANGTAGPGAAAVAGAPASSLAATGVPAAPVAAPGSSPATPATATAAAVTAATPAPASATATGASIVPSGLNARGVILPSALAGAASTGAAATGAPFNHSGVTPGQCFSCHDGGVHNGVKPAAKPANHIPSANACDACHRTTSWLPALFNHSQSPAGSTCSSCHNGRTTASRMPPRHMLTVRTCDTCHRTNGWVPVQYHHISPRYTSHDPSLRCDTCHVGNTEMVPLASIQPNLGGTRMRPH